MYGLTKLEIEICEKCGTDQKAFAETKAVHASRREAAESSHRLARDGAGGLTDVEREVCRALGNSEADVLATKRRRLNQAEWQQHTDGREAVLELDEYGLTREEHRIAIEMGNDLKAVGEHKRKQGIAQADFDRAAAAEDGHWAGGTPAPAAERRDYPGTPFQKVKGDPGKTKVDSHLLSKARELGYSADATGVRTMLDDARATLAGEHRGADRGVRVRLW